MIKDTHNSEYNIIYLTFIVEKLGVSKTVIDIDKNQVIIRYGEQHSLCK